MKGLGSVHEPRDSDIAVYSWVLEHQTIDQAAIAEDTGVAPDKVRHSIERLFRAHLLHANPNDPSDVYAVAPETATAELAAPLEARIRDSQRRIEELRAALNHFSAYYHRRRAPRGALEVLENVQDVRNALNRASERCREEVLTCQPGGGSRVPEAMQEALLRDQTMLRRGIVLRTLYHHTARFNGPSQAYVAANSDLGGQYRTSHELFGRLIVFDRELAFIPLHDNSLGAVVIREASIVAYLCQIFEQTWDRSTPFADPGGEGLEKVSREIHETIIRLLAAGLKDEAIARRLGMSLRTARRHIADILEQLDATSRFQAGVNASARGLTSTDTAERQLPH